MGGLLMTRRAQLRQDFRKSSHARLVPYMACSYHSSVPRRTRRAQSARTASDPGPPRGPRPYSPSLRTGRIDTVKPSTFVHHAPRSVDEALAVLGEFGHDGKVLACLLYT